MRTYLLPLYALLLLALAGPALAGWGDENWGVLIWGDALSIPGLGLLGLAVLAMGLAATAGWTLRKRRPALGLTLSLVLLVIPLAVAAGTVTGPNTFVNGTVADADQVNANFTAEATAVNDNDGRIGTLENLLGSTCPPGKLVQGISGGAILVCGP